MPFWFWIKIKTSALFSISVGHGQKAAPFMKYKSSTACPEPINYIGFSSERNMTWYFDSNKFETTNGNIHYIERNMNLNCEEGNISFRNKYCSIQNNLNTLGIFLIPLKFSVKILFGLCFSFN